MSALSATLRRSSLALATALILGSAALASCGDEPTAAIDRDTFVTVWVDLRTAAMAAPGGVVAPADRERILESHGVSEDDLLEFAEVHGGDVPFMVEVWAEVDARMSGSEATGGAEG